MAESLTKGDRAMVIGRLKSRSWETPEGDKRSVVEVARRFAGPSPSPGGAKNGEAKPGGEFNDDAPF